MGHRKLAFILVFCVFSTALWGQSTISAGGVPAPTPTPTPVSQTAYSSNEASDNPVKFLRNMGQDQKDIWTSPFKARIQDLNWIIPLTGLSVGLINADAEITSRITGTSTFSVHASTISNAGVGILVGGSGGLYLLGKIKGDEHKKETGILVVEAAANSYVVGNVLQLVTQRARPNDGNGQRRFLQQ